MIEDVPLQKLMSMRGDKIKKMTEKSKLSTFIETVTQTNRSHYVSAEATPIRKNTSYNYSEKQSGYNN